MPKNTYTFGDMRFTTQKAAREHFKWIKSRGPCVINRGDPDFAFLEALYLRSPFQPSEKIAAIHLAFHPNHGGTELGAILILEDGNQVDFPSAKYAFRTTDQDMETNPWSKWDAVLEEGLYSKMRQMVKYQVDTFRMSHPTGRCDVCGVPGTDVDHCGEFEFKAIRDMWLANVDKTRLEIIDETPDGANPVFSDMDIYASWCDHHSAYAEYQLLCKACHNSKKKREAA